MRKVNQLRTNSEINEILNFLHIIQIIKDLKVAVIKTLQQSIINSLETNEKVENLSKEIKGRTKESSGSFRMEFLFRVDFYLELRIFYMGSSRVEMMKKDGLSELQDTSVKFTASEKERK